MCLSCFKDFVNGFNGSRFILGISAISMYYVFRIAVKSCLVFCLSQDYWIRKTTGYHKTNCSQILRKKLWDNVSVDRPLGIGNVFIQPSMTRITHCSFSYLANCFRCYLCGFVDRLLQFGLPNFWISETKGKAETYWPPANFTLIIPVKRANPLMKTSVPSPPASSCDSAKKERIAKPWPGWPDRNVLFSADRNACGGRPNRQKKANTQLQTINKQWICLRTATSCSLTPTNWLSFAHRTCVLNLSPA